MRSSWGIWHEYGHQRQADPQWSWDAMGEVTVNIYALAALRMLPGASTEHSILAEWKAAERYLAQPQARRDFDTTPELFTRLAMFEQLRVVYGDGFYRRLHQMGRRSPVQDVDPDKKRLFMVLASKTAGNDLTAYFTKWGLRPDQQTEQAIAALKLPAPARDLTKVPVFQQRHPFTAKASPAKSGIVKPSRASPLIGSTATPAKYCKLRAWQVNGAIRKPSGRSLKVKVNGPANVVAVFAGR